MRIVSIWKEVLTTVRKNPKLLIPFIVVALFDLGLLYFLYLAPQRPVISLLGPPITRIWGERFLHYPDHLFLLPKLFYYAHLFLNASLGLLMTGLAIGMFRDVRGKGSASILINLIDAIRRYLALLGVWIIMFVISFFLMELFDRIEVSDTLASLFSIGTYFLVMLIQVIFIYAMPAIIIEKKGLIGGLKRGFGLLKKFFIFTIILTMVPALLYLPVLALRENLAGLIGKTLPEIIVAVTACGVLMTILIDIFFTFCPALVFLKERERE